MLKNNFLLFVVVLGFAFPAFAVNPETTIQVKNSCILKPTAFEEKVCKYISQNLLQKHYNKVTAKDSLSKEIFNRYLNNLDGSKSIFCAREIDSLRMIYGTRIIDECLDGQTKSGFAVYNLFLNRAKEKVQFMKAAAEGMHFNFSIPETITIDQKNSPWPADRNQLADLWKKELKYHYLNLLSSGETSTKLRLSLVNTYKDKEDVLNSKRPDDAFQAYITALTTSFDPHSSYLSPDKSESFQINMSRSVEGIGINLKPQGKYAIVDEIIPGGPAFKSNQLKKGDKIIGISQGKGTDIVDVSGWRINDVAKLIRGTKGTIVNLKILPGKEKDGEATKKIVQIERDNVDLAEKAARKSIIQQHGRTIGIITIPSFYLDFEGKEKNTNNYTSTSRDVARIIHDLNAAHVESIVIDLRNNGGGSLEEAVKVTGLFISGGPVVQIKNSTGKVAVLSSDSHTGKQYCGPLAVLVNRYSASASEIVAAAIQDYGRGVIIGERTYGKGTVQHMIKLADSPELGEIKLTVAKFYRISGGSTQHVGVVPDIIIPSLINSSAIGEDTYTNCLPWNTISRALYQPTSEINQKNIALLRKEFLEQSSKKPLYQSYLHDVRLLSQIRKKKTVLLQETVFKSEQEKIKQLEKKWGHEKYGAKNSHPDVLLNETAEIISNLKNIQIEKLVALHIKNPRNRRHE